jgi:hypothetical protein
VIVIAGALAGALKGHTDDAFNVPRTQSQPALDLLNAKFPGTGGADARIGFEAPRTQADRPAVQRPCRADGLLLCRPSTFLTGRRRVCEIRCGPRAA